MKRIALPEEGIETLYGAHDANLKHIENAARREHPDAGVAGDRRGRSRGRALAEQLFDQLKVLMDEGYQLTNGDVKTAAPADRRQHRRRSSRLLPEGRSEQGTRRRVNPKSVNQRKYLDAIEQFDIVFGVGPAARARPTWRWRRRSATSCKKVSRIILARPAVEAGRSSGSCPAICRRR
jgi:phosphate starvation-inducible PhoH-like protein